MALSRATQSRTPLHPTQQRSTISSTPTSSSNSTIKNRMSQHSSRQQQQSSRRSAPNTQVPSKQPALADRKRDSVSTAQLSGSSTGCGKETSSEWHNCPNKCRKLATKSKDATASTSSHDGWLKNPLNEENSKQSIEQSPQPSHTGNNSVALGHSSVTPHTAAAVTMTTEVTEVDSSKEGSTEVTPERVTCTLNSGSATKRRLKLEEGVSCSPGTKRRRTSMRDSSKKEPIAKVDSSPLEVKKSVQMTMQSFFRPS